MVGHLAETEMTCLELIKAGRLAERTCSVQIKEGHLAERICSELTMVGHLAEMTCLGLGYAYACAEKVILIFSPKAAKARSSNSTTARPRDDVCFLWILKFAKGGRFVLHINSYVDYSKEPHTFSDLEF